MIVGFSSEECSIIIAVGSDALATHGVGVGDGCVGEE